jgi:hypothetical protein
MRCKNCGKEESEHFKRNVRIRFRRPYWRGIECENSVMSTGVEQRLFCTKYGKKEFETTSKDTKTSEISE